MWDLILRANLEPRDEYVMPSRNTTTEHFLKHFGEKKEELKLKLQATSDHCWSLSGLRPLLTSPEWACLDVAHTRNQSLNCFAD